MQMLNPLFALSFQAARFGWEMQSVIALRLMRLAGGGPSGQFEARRIGTEKMAALAEAQTSATTVAIKGGNGPEVAKKALSVYKKRVRGNKRRLSR
jgi:hypothetical protein